MKVLFDHQIFSSQVYGGVSKYFAEIIHRMPADNWEITAWLSNNEYARNYKLFKMTPFLPHRNFRGKGRIMAELGKPYSLFKMIAGGYDVVHQTNFDPYLFKAIGSKPMVTTYHDVNFLTEHNYNARMVKLQTKSLNRADAIVAISENTRNDMLKYFDIDPGKITVIYHGIDTPQIPRELSGRVVESPYILFVGARHLFKNFTRFVKAFAQISQKYKDVKIVCTRSNFDENEISLFRQLGIEDRMISVPADEMTLNRLYRDALLFVFPSEYEGFGMPILEAMVNGCPTALADASCFPEIAGDAALYFEPKEIDSIAETLDIYLSDESIREKYSQLGLERAKGFSWSICAKKHFELYKSLV